MGSRSTWTGLWEAWLMESRDGLSMVTRRLDLDALLAEPD